MHKMKYRFVNAVALVFIFLSSFVIADEFVVVRGNEDYPPDEMHVDGELTGFHIELIREAAKSLSLNVRFIEVPWPRAISMLKHGGADAVSYVTPSKEREEFSAFIEGNLLSQSSYHFVTLKNRLSAITFDGDLTDLKPYRIGVQRGYHYGEAFSQADYLHTMEVTSVSQMMALLVSKRIDLGILTASEFHGVKKQMEEAGITYLQPPLSQIRNYLAFSLKSNAEPEAEAFAEAMSEFKKTERYQILRKKYDKD